MRLYAFLEIHHILYEKQFGFRKNNSTIIALMQGFKDSNVFSQREFTKILFTLQT